MESFLFQASIYLGAAVLVVQSAFLSAGQRCTAARRLIVKDDLYDQVVGEVKKIADRLVIGRDGSAEAIAEQRRKRLTDQTRLAGPGHARDRGEDTQGDIHREVVQVVPRHVLQA